MSYFRNITRSRKLRGTFFTTRRHIPPSLNEREKNDISATREAAGKRTKIAVRFLYYFFNGLRLSKNASERDIAPFTPQRYNIPPTLSKHFPSFSLLSSLPVSILIAPIGFLILSVHLLIPSASTIRQAATVETLFFKLFLFFFCYVLGFYIYLQATFTQKNITTEQFITKKHYT